MENVCKAHFVNRSILSKTLNRGAAELEVPAEERWKGWHFQYSIQQRRVAFAEFLHSQYLANGDAVRIAFKQFNLVACLDETFFEDAVVKTTVTAVEKFFQNRGVANFVRELEARQSRHGHLHVRFPDAKGIANAYFVFQKTARGEILAEGSGRKIIFTEHFFPMGVMFHRVGVRGLKLAAVDGEIGLAITGKREMPEPHGASDGLFINTGEDGMVVDLNFPGHRNIDGKKFHNTCALGTGGRKKTSGK